MTTIDLFLSVVALSAMAVAGWSLRGFFGGIGRVRDLMDKTSGVRQVPRPYDFEKDFAMLAYLMDTKIENARIFRMRPILEQKKGMIPDAVVEELSSEIVLDVITTLGEGYKGEILSRYFRDEEALNQFVSDSVYVAIVNESLRANAEKLSRLRGGELTRNVLRVNAANARKAQEKKA